MIDAGKLLVERMCAEGFTAHVGDGSAEDVDAGSDPAAVWSEITAIAGGAYVTWARGEFFAGWSLIIPENGEDAISDYSPGFDGDGELGSIIDRIFVELDQDIARQLARI